jgi:hypothetical protein
MSLTYPFPRRSPDCALDIAVTLQFMPEEIQDCFGDDSI